MRAAAVAFAVFGAAPAAAEVPPAGTNDFGGFRNVLAVGQGETADAVDVVANASSGAVPASYVNQLPLYRDLLYAAPALKGADLFRYFKPAGFGVPAAEALPEVHPRAGVTIVRDRSYRVPHVYGVTRADTIFGAGYASAQDRLFAMDVLRHLGRARLSELAGAGRNDANVALDARQLLSSDYTETELQRMIDDAAARNGAEGAQLRQDLSDYAAGVNQYIAEARTDANKLPGEYAALGKFPDDWKPTDSVAAASLIGGRFGRGGGSEDLAGEVLQEARRRFGGRRARRVFADFRRREDPEAPVTVSRRFTFDRRAHISRKAVAIPDRGSLRDRNPIVSGSDASAASAAPAGLSLASNALLVGRRASSSDHPFAVMGPQVEWHSPAILMEMDLHGPGIDARGATFPGLGFVILVGRGPDFAWSATTATADDVDLFAERLCEPGGKRPTVNSVHYVYRGRCRPMLVRRHVLHTSASPGSDEAPRTITLEVRRTVHGPVQSRGTVRGRPVAFAEDRATYMHEIDSALAFERLSGDRVSDPRSFQRAVGQVNFAFNWFYVDDRHVAYMTSGWYPSRARGVDPDFPAWGTGRWDWRDWNPSSNLSRRLPLSRLPKVVDPRQGYIVNWNNKQAPGWRAADDQWAYGSVFRSLRLEDPLRRDLRRRGELGVTRLVQIAELAATVDVRGKEIYPLLRRVIGRHSGHPQLDRLLALLDAWRAGGSHRRDLDRDNVFDQSAAVALMDAWEPRYTRAIFEPVIGRRMFDAVARLNPVVDTPPYNRGSGFGSGWYSYVDKDLRALLHRRIRGRLSRRYCGEGSRRACRRLLIESLARAADAVARAQGGSDPATWKVAATCQPLAAGDPLPKRCDQIEFQSLGAISMPPIPWQDRPTFQQVVEVQGHRSR